MAKKTAVGQMEIATIKLEEVVPSKYNPRRISEQAMAGLTASIRRFGYVEPIVVNRRAGRYYVVGGHQRLAVLTGQGAEEAACVVVRLDAAREKALNVTLNNPRIQGEFTAELDGLLAEIREGLGGDWLTELEMAEMGNLQEVDAAGLIGDDEVPEAKENRCRPGDLWVCGRHRLLCGDATLEADVRRLMNSEKAKMCFTSPPYWVGFEYENESQKNEIIKHIDASTKNMTLFVLGKIVINTGNISTITTAKKITGKKQPALLIDWWVDAMNKYKFYLRHIRIWAKPGGVTPSRKNNKIDMHWEYLGLFTQENGNAGFISTFCNKNDNEGIKKNTPAWAVVGVWSDIPGAARSSGHVAAFPLELVWRYVIMYSELEDIFYEPYCGSGTTMIACEKTGRRCFGMEIDPGYCDVILARWEAFTGQTAVREKT